MWENNGRSRGEALNRYRGAYPPPPRPPIWSTCPRIWDGSRNSSVVRDVGRRASLPRPVAFVRRERQNCFPDKSARASAYSDGAKAGLATKGPVRPVLPDMLVGECAPYVRVGETSGPPAMATAYNIATAPNYKTSQSGRRKYVLLNLHAPDPTAPPYAITEGNRRDGRRSEMAANAVSCLGVAPRINAARIGSAARRS